ncbi:hypothetical protein IscW_ISCW008477 [Ixodes scapularis]|uniref:Uncharacterized protein n=1 Tax=Ixodes scapularis TaxID=6945 RepID=B7PVV7_IXOSC|nr:hypothetical protein IscW_ISCW008477 [Ixodes scapularis]|eukprot:XP_002408701.1 hypothetical protein IscW_ISCW008477 [Ixodes scapularis]
MGKQNKIRKNTVLEVSCKMVVVDGCSNGRLKTSIRSGDASFVFFDGEKRTSAEKPDPGRTGSLPLSPPHLPRVRPSACGLPAGRSPSGDGSGRHAHTPVPLVFGH